VGDKLPHHTRLLVACWHLAVPFYFVSRSRSSQWPPSHGVCRRPPRTTRSMTRLDRRKQPWQPGSAPQRATSVSYCPSCRPEPPGYGQRNGFVPRSNEDFGDGGAFPEIHVAQYEFSVWLPCALCSRFAHRYPLDIGRPGTKVGGSTSCSID
jgi:hypothetical protein